MYGDSLPLRPRIDATCSNPKCNNGIFGVVIVVDVTVHEITDNNKTIPTHTRFMTFCPSCWDNMSGEVNIGQLTKIEYNERDR